MSEKQVGVPTLKRLPLYLRLLKKMREGGQDYASGAVVARELGLDPIVVRKDLAMTGTVGRPRLGFPLVELIESIEHFLGWTNISEAFLAGTGSLGSALLGYEGFEQHGLRIVRAFDANPNLIGKKIHGVKVLPIKKLPAEAEKHRVQIGVLTVPAAAAQEVADTMIAGGIRGIWNFTPAKLNVPEGVILQRIDLASSLAVLSHRLLSSTANDDPSI